MGSHVLAAAILTVSEAAARRLKEKFPPGSRAQVLGGAALQAAVVAAAMTPAPTGGKVVVVGLDAAVTCETLTEAVQSVSVGAEFVVTGFDCVLLAEQGVASASGSMVAAIRAWVEAVPVSVGKPCPSMFEMAAVAATRCRTASEPGFPGGAAHSSGVCLIARQGRAFCLAVTYNPVMTYPGAGIEIRSFEPYYQQLKRILINEIENNHEGDLLPSESELCRRYSVSRTVVRQALNELEREGLVLKVKGKGTYVTGRPLNTSFVQHSLGFYESMQRAGHTVGTKVITLQTEPCGASLAKVLEIGMEEDVIHFDRVRSVDGLRVQVVRTALPARLFPGLVQMDMTDCSLYQVLADNYGVQPATGHRAIDATALSSEDAHHLQATEGLPALRIESVTRSSEGVLFEYYVAVYRGHSFRFELDVISP